MKREEKSRLSRQRILDAAMRELSDKGYDAASMNAICAENNISKGIIYHYFQDKDELYLQCAADCYNHLTDYLRQRVANTGTAEGRLQAYFDTRLRFFAENPVYLGIFLNTILTPPAHLSADLAQARAAFDALNIRILTEILEGAALRQTLVISEIVEDFRMYMDYFNARFKTVLGTAETAQQAFAEHELRCHRQLNILMHGVLEKNNE